MDPLISIIIPCFNQAKFLEQTLLSVYNQSYTIWECIIINDGSIDNSESIALDWANKDNRFKYFYEENKGVSAARNLALENVSGTYIQFLDADDVLDSRKLELSLNFLKKFPYENKQIVISNFRMFTSNETITTEPYCVINEELLTYDNLILKWNESFSIPIHCGIFESSLFENIRFPENLTAQEDWIVWVKLFKLNIQTFFLDEPLALYRQNPESRTMSKSIYTDQIKAFEILKTILTDEEFYEFSKVLIFRYYKEQELFKGRLQIVKKSHPYQAGLMIKKVLNAFGLLRLSRKLFPVFIKFKSK